MKAKPQNPEYKKAYYVKSWGNEIIEGHAFIMTHFDYYPVTKAYFIEANAEYPIIVDYKQVVFTPEYAKNLFDRESKSRKEYYEKQLKEAQKELGIKVESGCALNKKDLNK